MELVTCRRSWSQVDGAHEAPVSILHRASKILRTALCRTAVVEGEGNQATKEWPLHHYICIKSLLSEAP
ncbi:hypothetical protein EJB05_03091, partial [Eragrostis curvula]